MPIDQEILEFIQEENISDIFACKLGELIEYACQLQKENKELKEKLENLLKNKKKGYV